MTAQQQLAGLLKYGATLPGFRFDCVAFVNTHGPAIAELIESELARAKECAAWDKGGSSIEKMLDAEVRTAAALRKLTQEATP